MIRGSSVNHPWISGSCTSRKNIRETTRYTCHVGCSFLRRWFLSDQVQDLLVLFRSEDRESNCWNNSSSAWHRHGRCCTLCQIGIVCHRTPGSPKVVPKKLIRPVILHFVKGLPSVELGILWISDQFIAILPLVSFHIAIVTIKTSILLESISLCGCQYC